MIGLAVSPRPRLYRGRRLLFLLQILLPTGLILRLKTLVSLDQTNFTVDNAAMLPETEKPKHQRMQGSPDYASHLHTTNATSQKQNRYRIEYADYRSRFPVPEWLDAFLNSQPTETHKQMLQNPSERFIVMTCDKFEHDKDEECGGLSDRLRQLPYFLWLAYKTNRRLLIKYAKPSPLESFLVPADDSAFDWRLPDGYFAEDWQRYRNRTAKTYKIMRSLNWETIIDKPPWNNTRVIFVNNNLALGNVASKMNANAGIDFNDVLPGIFRRLFQPSEGVRKAIEETAARHGLMAGDYAAAHLRLKWPLLPPKRLVWLNNRMKGDKQGGGLNLQSNYTVWNFRILSDNIIDCAMKIMPDTKRIYFASDANEASKYLLRESPWSWGSSNTTFGSGSWNFTNRDFVPKVVMRLNVDDEPIHFDRRTSTDVSQLYPIFVDLWIMGHAKCSSHGVGGFPRFAASLTGNYDTCRMSSWSHSNGSVTYCPQYLNRFGMNLKRRTVVPI